MFAVIKTGGKQYRVETNDVLVIEKLDGEAGSTVAFDDVLMMGEGDDVTVGAPIVDGASVQAEVLETRKGDKVLVFKKKRRQNYRRKKGHRQMETVVRITDILAKGDKPKAKAKKAESKAETKKEEPKKAAPKKSAAKSKADDLSLISGIGPKFKKELAGVGITTFKQMAELKKKEIEEIEEKIGAQGRFENEEWVAQAKELMAGEKPRAKVDQEAAKKAD